MKSPIRISSGGRGVPLMLFIVVTTGLVLVMLPRLSGSARDGVADKIRRPVSESRTLVLPYQRESPPDVMIRVSRSHGVNGVLLYQTWRTKEGIQPVDYSDPPIVWPETVAMSARTPIIVLIQNGEAPSYMLIKAWDQLRDDGVPEGEPIEAACHNPARVGDSCIIVREQSEWLVRIPPFRRAGITHVVLTGVWNGRTGSSTASWMFSIATR